MKSRLGSMLMMAGESVNTTQAPPMDAKGHNPVDNEVYGSDGADGTDPVPGAATVGVDGRSIQTSGLNTEGLRIDFSKDPSKILEGEGDGDDDGDDSVDPVALLQKISDSVLSAATDSGNDNLKVAAEHIKTAAEELSKAIGENAMLLTLEDLFEGFHEDASASDNGTIPTGAAKKPDDSSESHGIALPKPEDLEGGADGLSSSKPEDPPEDDPEDLPSEKKKGECNTPPRKEDSDDQGRPVGSKEPTTPKAESRLSNLLQGRI